MDGWVGLGWVGWTTERLVGQRTRLKHSPTHPRLLPYVYSIVGAVRVGSHLLYLLSPWGGFSFRDTICEPPEVRPPTHPPTHPPTSYVQYLIQTTCVSSILPPTVAHSNRLLLIYPPTQPPRTAAHSNRLRLLYPPTHPPTHPPTSLDHLRRQRHGALVLHFHHLQAP